MGHLKRSTLAGAIPLLLLVGIGYYGLFSGEYGWLDLREMRQEQARSLAELDSLRTEMEEVRERIVRLREDPAAVERVARERYGMIREGELMYRFVPADPVKAGSHGS